MKDIIKSFLVGSSFPVLFPFFITVMNIPDSVKNYSYESYTILAPLFIGVMNILSQYLGKTFISFLSPLIVILIAYFSKSYNFLTPDFNFKK